MRRYLFTGMVCFFLGLTPALSKNTERQPEGRAAIESSLTLQGEIEINSKGEVQKVSLSQKDKIAPDIAAFVERRVSTWKFQPVLLDGAPVAASSKMSVFLTAKKNPEGGHKVFITSANFDNSKPGEVVSGNYLSPPKFPRDAAYSGVYGTVYVAVQVGRDGKVQQAAVQRVDMKVLASPSVARKFRSILAKTSVDKAKTWTFHPPTSGKSVNDPYWTLFVPVEFMNPNANEPLRTYGEWNTYVRGPAEIIPWPVSPSEDKKLSALSAGSIYQVGSGLKLISPLDES
jgi:hypothetical protein